jgi:hypothetical protein
MLSLDFVFVQSLPYPNEIVRLYPGHWQAVQIFSQLVILNFKPFFQPIDTEHYDDT